MGIEQEEGKDLFWNYYISLVVELVKTSNYVEFNKDNYNTYSIELAKLLMTASSECDVVLKQISNLLNPKKKHKTIDDYRKTIKKYLPNTFCKEEVYISRHRLTLRPWTNWDKNNTSPKWWRAYNNVKHERDRKYVEATLHNALNSMAALLVCIIYFRALMKLNSDETFNEKNLVYHVRNVLQNLDPDDGFLKLIKYYP
jgi:hypothetical protein